ncbi:MAG: hypothetical protein ACFBSE_14805 [Prochloraceae cyanobacterium]
MKGVRIGIVTIAGFIALTAIGGGIAMLIGVDKFPLEWLEGTPFKDYTIPALILAIAVGGSSLLAAITVVTHRKNSPFATILAGIIMSGYITVEVLILKQNPPGPTIIEDVYFILGGLLFVLGILLYRSQSNLSKLN